MKPAVLGMISVTVVVLIVGSFMVNLSSNTRSALQEAADEPGQWKRELADKGYANGQDALRQGKLDLAIVSFTDALRMNPGHYDALLARGQVYLKRGQWKKAVDDLNGYLQHHPDNDQALVSRAVAHCRLKKFAQAVEDCDQVLARDPGALAFAIRGEALLGQKQYAAALSDLCAAININPHCGPAYARRSVTHLALGNAQEAAWDLAAALLLGASVD